MRLLHLVPYALFGGTEKDCFFFARDYSLAEHHIWVLGTEGPMTEKWEELTPFIKHLNILKESPRLFTKRLKMELANSVFDGVLYWSTIRLPFVRNAMNGHSKKLAVHVGNPVKTSLTIGIKNTISAAIYNSNIETKLFACSNYVEKTISKDWYLRKFDSATSLNPVEIPPANEYYAKEITLDSNINLGMVARLYPIKDHETVIRSFKVINQKYPKAKLHLLGDGILMGNLKKLVEELKLRDSVEFLGGKDNVYGFLRELDIFLYGTTPGEGLGNAVSEAMANGLPCVVSDLPMLQEIAGDNQNVIFCKPYDPNDMANKTMDLIKDRKQRKQISINAYERALYAFSSKRYIEDRMSFLLG